MIVKNSPDEIGSAEDQHLTATGLVKYEICRCKNDKIFSCLRTKVVRVVIQFVFAKIPWRARCLEAQKYNAAGYKRELIRLHLIESFITVQ